MKFVLNRNRAVASVMGHVIEFEKGVPTHVPPECWAEVQAIGAVPETEILEEDKPADPEPKDPAARKELIFKTFEKLVMLGKREDFSANGAPHAKAMAREMGFKIDNRERDSLWTEFKLKDKDD